MGKLNFNLQVAKDYLYEAWCSKFKVKENEKGERENLSRFLLFLVPYELEEMESEEDLQEILGVIFKAQFEAV